MMRNYESTISTWALNFATTKISPSQNKMNPRSTTQIATGYFMIAVALLHHSSHGAEAPELLVTYSVNNMDDRVSLECRDRPSGILQSGATYTFKDPESGRIEYSVTETVGSSYTFTIHPSNESLITCSTLCEFGESDPVMVAGIVASSMHSMNEW